MVVAHVLVADLGEDGFYAIFAFVGDIAIVCTRFFQSQADVLATARYARPVNELVRLVFGGPLAFAARG